MTVRLATAALLLAAAGLAAPAAALSSATVSSGHSEDCVAGWTNDRGEPQAKAIVLDLASPAKLDRAALPPGASGIMCRRSSIVPRPDDIRVLIELGVSFGILDEGKRSLWIWARAGRVKAELDHGRLSPAEKAAVKKWVIASQARFDLALAEARTD